MKKRPDMIEIITDHTSVRGSRLLPLVRHHLKERFPGALWMGNPERRQVALTFDDGPDPVDTPQLLDVLARQRVRATFCWLGEKIEGLPLLATDTATAGHQIGIHGYRHRPFLFEVLESLRGQLAYTRDIIVALTGRDPAQVRDVRPPYAVTTPAMLRTLGQWGYRPFMGSIVPVHWAQPLAETVAQVAGEIHGGSLIVLHEANRGPAVADVADALIARLKADSYEFITIDQMWQSMTAAPLPHDMGPSGV